MCVYIRLRSRYLRKERGKKPGMYVYVSLFNCLLHSIQWAAEQSAEERGRKYKRKKEKLVTMFWLGVFEVLDGKGIREDCNERAWMMR